MTIALGILAHDAVVIATDTQVGVSDYLKTSQGKISLTTHSRRQEPTEDMTQTVALAVTGAGKPQHIRHLQKDFKRFVTTAVEPSIDEFDQSVSDRIRQFHTDHILPLGTTRTDLYMLVAYCKDGVSKLWRSEDNLLTESTTYAAVGAGEMYANIIMNRLSLPMWPMTAKTAFLLAAYVIHRVKDRIDGCGKNTEIVCIRSQESEFFSQTHIKPVEDLLDKFWGIEANVLSSVFGGGGPAPKDLSVELHEFAMEIDGLPVFQMPLFQ